MLLDLMRSKAGYPIVAAGVAQTPVYDSFTAGREEGKQSSGTRRRRRLKDASTCAVESFMRPGGESGSMIRSTKSLYITRF
jgi:hypothetical protein